jgi:hypothetical protein
MSGTYLVMSYRLITMNDIEMLISMIKPNESILKQF